MHATCTAYTASMHISYRNLCMCTYQLHYSILLTSHMYVHTYLQQFAPDPLPTQDQALLLHNHSLPISAATAGPPLLTSSSSTTAKRTQAGQLRKCPVQSTWQYGLHSRSPSWPPSSQERLSWSKIGSHDSGTSLNDCRIYVNVHRSSWPRKAPTTTE